MNWLLRNTSYLSRCAARRVGFTRQRGTVNILWHIRSGDLCINYKDHHFFAPLLRLIAEAVRDRAQLVRVSCFLPAYYHRYIVIQWHVLIGFALGNLGKHNRNSGSLCIHAILRQSVYLRWHLPHPNPGYFPDFWLFASICFCRISAAAVSLIIEETRKEAQKELTSGSVIDNCRLLNLAFRSFLSQGCVVYLARLLITERYEKVFFFHFNPISFSSKKLLQSS